jgi:hypothetical protein
MPYAITEEGQEPMKALVRRSEILKWLSIGKGSFDKIVREGLLPYKVLIPRGVRYYRKEDVERVFLRAFRTSTSSA